MHFFVSKCLVFQKISLHLQRKRKTNRQNMKIRLSYKDIFDVLSGYGNQAWNREKNQNKNLTLQCVLCPSTSRMDMKKEKRV